MKPLNHDDPGCNYTTSNCVIWQGPDISCIKLCKGDSISDVIFKLATELCKIMDDLDVDNYDISCLNITTCPPGNFHDLLQTLITIICELQAGIIIPGTLGARSNNTADQIPVALCFYYVDPLGNTITTMTVDQYVTALGNWICPANNAINSLNQTVAVHTDQISTLQTRVAAIPSDSVQLITPVCVLSSIPTEETTVVIALEQQFCQLQSAIGSSTEIFKAIRQQCVGLAEDAVLGGRGGNMASIPGWNSTLLNMAAAMNNIWLTLCDVRVAIKNIQATCCPTACNSINLTMFANFTNPNLTIFVNGNIPAGFANCLAAGALVTITDDTGGSMTAYVDIVALLNNPSGFNVIMVSPPINISSNFHVNIDACLTNSSTSATCQRILDYVVVNEIICPSMTYIADRDSISYSGSTVIGTNSYDVQLWNNAGTILIANQVQTITGPNPLNGAFLALTPNTTFRIRVVITNASETVTTCPFQAVALTPSLIPPVPLGTAGSFAILAGLGVTNIGALTAIIGNVGSDPTNTITGLVPGQVTGTLYTVSDPAVIAAKVDFATAFNNAAARVPVTTIPTALGGAVITPGNYNSATGNFDITGNVTLNGLGDANAVFVFQMAGTLTTALGSTVILINGATDANIFWNVGGSATLGEDSIFRGNILALTNITLVNSAHVTGRLLAQNIVTLDTNIVNLP